MKKLSHLFVALVIMAASQNTSLAQGFQKTYGGTQDDRAFSVIQTTDGGYCVAGNTGSSASTQYLHVVKFDNSMNVQWTFRINASSPNQTGRSLIQTADGGYVIAGNNNGIGPSAGSRDYYILKLDNSGSLQWTRVLDQNGAGNNSLYSIAETADGGFICSGTTDASCNTGNIALIKLNSDGTYNWKQNFGACAGSGDSWPARVVIADDGGFVVAGTSNSGSNGGGDLYLLKTNSSGTIQWGKRVGGSSYLDQGFALTKAADGGFAVAGHTRSYPTAHAGVGKNVYVVKFDSGGGLQWTRTVGGTSSSNSGDNIAYSIIETQGDNGFLVAGSTTFYGTGGGIDGYAAKLTSSGTLSWTKAFGRSSTDEIQSVIQNANGDFIMAGYSALEGTFDWYLLTMASDGSICGPNISSGGFSGSGGATGTDTNNPTTTLTDRGTSGTTSSFTGQTKSLFSVSVSASSDSICSGGSTTLTASGASTYTWSPSDGLNTTTGSVVVASPTTTITNYIVTGTNSSFCSASASILITVSPTMTITASPSFTICSGQSTELTATGGSSYSWNTGATTMAITVNPSSTTSYSVQITNALGCSASASDTVDVKSANTPTVSISSVTQVSCTSDSTGAITASISGGTSPFKYEWNTFPVQTTSSITHLGTGIYIVTVTDANGCVTEAGQVISESALTKNDSLQQWIETYNGDADMADVINALVAKGSIYVAGSTKTASNGNDYLIIKYDINGARLWSQTYNGPNNGNDEATAIAVDGSGNVYVTGSSTGSGTGKDYATLKYDSDGNLSWTSRYSGSANGTDSAIAIAVYSNTVVVTGYITQTSTGKDYGTIAYSASNGSQQWLQAYTGTSSGSIDEASSMTTDKLGNMIVNGRSTGSNGRDMVTIKYQLNGTQSWLQRYSDNLSSTRLHEKDPVTVDSVGNVFASGTLNSTTDYAVIKYNAAGTLKWAQTYNGAGNNSDQVLGIATDKDRNVYVTGYAKSSSNDDFATISYDSTGQQRWLQTYNGSANSNDFATAIALDDSNKVYVTGKSTGNCTGLNYVTIKYISSGTLVWTQLYDGPSHSSDIANSIAVGNDQNIYVAGSETSVNGNDDAVTIKYNQISPGQINQIGNAADLVAQGLLEVSTKSSIKNLFYNNIDTLYTDSTGIYYYVTLPDLIEAAAGIDFDLLDSMNATLNKIYTTSAIDYLSDIVDGLPLNERQVFPIIFIPHLSDFDETERNQNPYLGYCFLEENYPLNGYSGLDVIEPIEKVITRDDMLSKPTWLLSFDLPNHSVVNGDGNIFYMAECAFKTPTCLSSCSNTPLGGISNTDFLTTNPSLESSCDPANFTAHELHILTPSDNCISSYELPIDNPLVTVPNFTRLSAVVGSTYWVGSSSLGIRDKKMQHPILNKNYTKTGGPKSGEALSLCTECNKGNLKLYDLQLKEKIGIGSSGIYQLWRANQQPLYFVRPNSSLEMWIGKFPSATNTPDGAIYFGLNQPGGTCSGLTKTEEHYEYSDAADGYTPNPLGINTQYLASTQKSDMVSYWNQGVITVSFVAPKAITTADILPFVAPESTPIPFFNPLIFSKIADLSLYPKNSTPIDDEYTIIAPIFLNVTKTLYVYVQAKFSDGKSIKAVKTIKVVGTVSKPYGEVQVEIRGPINDHDKTKPQVVQYKVQVFSVTNNEI